MVDDDQYVGFAHLGVRADAADWLEHLYVKPQYRNKGLGSEAIKLLEDIVKEYSISMYIEVSARNLKAMDLYHRLGFDTLNTITIRKDFTQGYECIAKENIAQKEFKVKTRYK